MADAPRGFSCYTIQNESSTWRRNEDGEVAALTFHRALVDWNRRVCTIYFDEHRDCSYENKQLTFAFELWEHFNPSSEFVELAPQWAFYERDHPTPVRLV